ncbi:5-hydroxytryptamine receptor 2B-like [Mytilus californianus]|uniref:5-hydroxytryptamine receptor 2B-like n=1 Tax=Mytilus californianus TaxID=6549 RepID=UPI002246DC0C|nr:5-hydroxytryptamine receptor 2B-like [Mytilus californianus]
MASNSTNGTHTNLREIEYQGFIEKDIPTALFLIFLSVIGTIGNIHTILVYILSPIMAKYSVRVFIIWLAFIDLTASVFCMPFEIFDMRYDYTFSSEGACKFFKFLNHVVTGASSLLLTTIAIERYRIFVKNLPILITNSQRSNVISAVLVGVSMILSIPVLIYYGLNKNETNIFGLMGKECRFFSDYQNIRHIGVYYSIVSFIGLVCVVMCIFSYGKILHGICTRKEWRKSIRKKSVSSLNSTSDIRSGTTQLTSTIHNEAVKLNELQTGTCDRANRKSTRSSHNLGNSIRLTISLMIATAVSYIGNMLYVITKMVQILNPKMHQNSIRPIFDIIKRGYFVNNASNPIVFCVLDRNFRQECLKLYGKICPKKNISPE